MMTWEKREDFVNYLILLIMEFNMKIKRKVYLENGADF